MASPALTALAALAAALPGAAGLHMARRTSPERACSETPDVDFSDYVRRHERTYLDDPGEYSLRAGLFSRAKEAVRRHNCETARPLWVASVNHLADRTDAELQSLKGLDLSSRRGPSGAAPSMRMRRAGQGAGLPDTVSYGNLSTIRDARNQGHCGSCWAFSAETAMRARAELKGLPHKFSVGQIVACAPNPNECGGKGGCKGATAELAYEYALQAGLVQEDAERLEVSYPLEGGQPACPGDMAMSGSEGESSKGSMTSDGHDEHVAGAMAASLRNGRNTGMVGWTRLPENMMEPIIRALVESGPLTVSVAAGHWWHYYTEGIMPGSDCDENNVIGHAVVLFGIGKENVEGVGPVKYWHLKNSWGNSWGEDGHIRVEMTENEEEQCGWDHRPGSGSGCIGGPEKVWVCGSCAILNNAAMPLF